MLRLDQSSQWIGGSVNKLHKPSVCPSAIYLISAPGRCPLTHREVSGLHYLGSHVSLMFSSQYSSVFAYIKTRGLDTCAAFFKKNYFANPAHMDRTVTSIAHNCCCEKRKTDRKKGSQKENNSTVKDIQLRFMSFLRGLLLKYIYTEIFQLQSCKDSCIFWLFIVL